MKINKIRAVNFLSHSDTAVDFRNINSVVAVGSNGAGKSSFLVDSILCCLFGKGRASDIDSFVRVGKDLMQLEVEFSINGKNYRVVRKRSRKTARGTSALEFFEIDQEGNEIKNLTLGTVGETQALLEKILGINYDILVRSAVIEQGEADSFVEASPSERMELFTEIWDLRKYDDFAQIARDTVRELSERQKLLDERIDLAYQKIDGLLKESEGKEVVEKELAKVNNDLIEFERKKENYQKKLGSFDSLLGEIEEAKFQQEQAERELKSISEFHSNLLSKIDRYEKIIKNRDAVVKRSEEEKEKELLLDSLTNEFTAKTLEIARMKDEIDGLRKDFQKGLNGIREKEKAIDSELKKLRDEELLLNNRFSDLKVKEERLGQMVADAEKLNGIKCHPEVDLFYVNEKCIFIKDAVEAKKRIPALREEIDKERKELYDMVHDNSLKRKEFEGEKDKFEKEIESLEKDLHSKVEIVENQIANCQFERNRLENEISRVKEELKEIKKFTKILPEIELAEKELPNLIEEEKRTENRAKEVMGIIEKRKKEIEAKKQKLAGRDDIERQLHFIASRVEELSKRREEMVKKLGFIEAGARQIEELKKQIESDEKELGDIGSKKAIYQTLEEAFKQIPYMLVSRSIGAVERKANEILGLISSTGLRVEIKTEKMTKTTKKMKDEIHIIIHDNDGEKPYKFLSGGEKLRVALALRLAIGEVFASRRGANIETLIADEIFGPLDEEGVEDVKQVFRELRQRFKFIGVISHVTESKDLFENQLFFEKGKNGTVVRMIDNF